MSSSPAKIQESLNAQKKQDIVNQLNKLGAKIGYRKIESNEEIEQLREAVSNIMDTLLDKEFIEEAEQANNIHDDLYSIKLPINHHSPTQPPSRDSNSDSSLTDQPGLRPTFTPAKDAQQSKISNDPFQQYSREQIIALTNQELFKEPKVKSALEKQGLPTELSIQFTQKDARKFIQIAIDNVEGTHFKKKKELQEESKKRKLSSLKNTLNLIDKIFPETAPNPIKKPTVEKQACCSVM